MASEKYDAFVIFATVGDVESISGAARSLGLPKATVSRAVSSLETIYNVKLIERTARRSLLTEAGKIMHHRSCRMREEIADVASEIAAHRGEPVGTLRIGCSSDIARSVLTPYLHEFLNLYPDIDLRVHVGERLLPEATALDVVLHSGWLSDSRLVARKFTQVQTILVASRDYVAQRGLPKSPDNIVDHAIIGNFYLDENWVTPGRLPAYVPKLELVRGSECFVLPSWKRFASTDHAQILELVRHGQVIAPMAALTVVDDLCRGDLVHIFPEYKIKDCPTLYALYADRVSMVPKLKVFLEFVDKVINRQLEALKSKVDKSLPQSR